METTFAFGFLVFILSYAGNLVLIVEVDVVHFFFAVEKSLIEIDVSNEYYIEMHTATPWYLQQRQRQCQYSPNVANNYRAFSTPHTHVRTHVHRAHSQ